MSNFVPCGATVGHGARCSKGYLCGHCKHIEKLETVAEAARSFDASPEDAQFKSPHPVFLMAAERDELVRQYNKLKDENKRLREQMTQFDGEV